MMMKKFLALFLVLVMALTCVLVSCNKKPGEGDSTSASSEDDGWMTPPPATTTEAPTEAPTVTTAPDKPSTDYTWTTDSASTKVYVRIDALNVRSDTLMTEQVIVGTVKFGESYTRVKYNDQWTVISYNGQERYVSTAYITTDSGSVVFDDITEKTVYINVEATLNLRTSTFVTMPDGTKYDGNIYAPVKRGVAVTQTGVSKNGNWARVKYDGKILYCNTSYLSDTVPSDDPSVTPTPTPTPVG